MILLLLHKYCTDASDLSIGLKSLIFVEGQLSKIFSNKVKDVKVWKYKLRLRTQINVGGKKMCWFELNYFSSVQIVSNHEVLCPAIMVIMYIYWKTSIHYN